MIFTTSKSKGNFISGIVFIVLVLAGTFFAVFSRDGKDGEGGRDNRVAVDLNATLTNELSSLDGLAGLDKDVREFMKRWNIEGASLSIMRNDSLVYAKGYGWADRELGVDMSPATLLRLASVSKLITATGIMILCERDSISLDTHVFGEGGILNRYDHLIRDKRIFDIDIRQLLTHSAGFGCRRTGDPMFPGVFVESRETLMRTALRRYLSFKPGTSTEYSNFGYLLLSMVIETVTGQSYESWMQDNVLRPAGCLHFHMAGNSFEERNEGEARYRDYGANNIHLLSGAGAWVASTPELARFVASIDGKEWVPDIIAPETVRDMTFTTDSQTYAFGWNDIKETGEWTRTGTLASTSALIKYYPDGECWILVTNCGTWKGPRLTSYSSYLFRQCRDRWSAALPHRDFFYY